LNADFNQCSQVWPVSADTRTLTIMVTTDSAAPTTGCWWASP
jgi:hypothetical protein